MIFLQATSTASGFLQDTFLGIFGSPFLFGIFTIGVVFLAGYTARIPPALLLPVMTVAAFAVSSFFPSTWPLFGVMVGVSGLLLAMAIVNIWRASA